jgi:uncharacterized protein YegP (UPF0339 family)
MAARFVLKAAAGGQFMFNLKAGNNEVILTSELYTQKASAEAGIESVRKNAPDDARFEREMLKGNAEGVIPIHHHNLGALVKLDLPTGGWGRMPQTPP